MNLTEILDTRVDVTWSKGSLGYIGDLKLEGHDYQIQLDEYDLALESGPRSLLDFGFTRDGSWGAVSDPKSSSKVFGAVINGVIVKLNELKPDVILFGINQQNGAVVTRISLYDRLATFYAKGSPYHHLTKWFKTPNGQYRALTKTALSAADLKKLDELAASIPVKT